jgi:hypothetical protein
MMTTTEISNNDDIIDVRDIIARVEELEDVITEGQSDRDVDDEVAELRPLEELLRDLCGNGGDEQWRGDWYPVTLIRDDYFETYAQELAEDIGAVPADYTWPTSCIDWEAAARDLRMDYTSVEFNGVTYWTR